MNVVSIYVAETRLLSFVDVSAMVIHGDICEHGGSLLDDILFDAHVVLTISQEQISSF